MATGAQVWSTTAGSNNSIDSAVNWAEGQAPSSVNDSARALMASAASHIGDNSGVIATAGSSTAYTITSKQVSTGFVDGYTIAARFHAANAAGATLSVDGVGAKAIQIYSGTNTAGSEIFAGSVHRLTYSSASTSWILNNFTPVSLSVISAVSATISSSLDVSGATKVVALQAGAITATSATLTSSLDVTGATKVAALTGTSATLTSSLDISGNTKVVALTAGALTGTSATLSSSLEVTKATLLSSALTVSGLVTTAGQVSFPATQNPSSDVNTLDDYEEGTFTPVLAFGGGSTGISYVTQLGGYIKIGKLVNIWIHIVLSNNGSVTGAATISGLPFTSATRTVALACGGDGITATSNFVAELDAASTTIDLLKGDDGSPSNMTETEIGNGSTLIISGSYVASA